jgi:hypothetical protein
MKRRSESPLQAGGVGQPRRKGERIQMHDWAPYGWLLPGRGPDAGNGRGGSQGNAGGEQCPTVHGRSLRSDAPWANFG